LNRLEVEAPASSANLGPGFDVFALALDRPRDKIRLGFLRSEKLKVEVSQKGGPVIPLSATRNGAAVVCLAIARSRDIKGTILLEMTKGVPIGQGMGSSGASAAAAALAMNEFFDLGMSDDELVFYAGKGEEATSGAPHYDNVSAALLGGFVVVQCGERPTTVKFEPPRSMAVCIATPTLSLPGRKTEYARSILPKEVNMKMMVSNVANASLMVSGFARGDIELIGKGMSDNVIQDVRKQFIPGYDLVRERAIDAGAAGVCISGAGPSILAIVNRRKVEPRSVMDSMVAAFRKTNVESKGLVTKVGKGAMIV
jgi:homoserine kinase